MTLIFRPAGGRLRSISPDRCLHSMSGSLAFGSIHIRDVRDYCQHVDYIYINSVKHGWAQQVKSWPFSTFHRDVKLGLYPENWAGEITDLRAGERA